MKTTGVSKYNYKKTDQNQKKNMLSNREREQSTICFKLMALFQKDTSREVN